MSWLGVVHDLSNAKHAQRQPMYFIDVAFGADTAVSYHRHWRCRCSFVTDMGLESG